MTTPTPIPDFCVSSQADGFDEFLKVFNEHLRDIVGFADNKRTGYYYGYENGSPISIQEAWIPLILTHQAIALLTAKPLTEGLVRGNNFECIESFLSFRDEVMYKKGKEYKCDVDGMLRNEHGTLDNLDKTLLNRHFKLLPTTQEESVKGEDEIRTHDTVVCGWNDEGELVYIRTFDVEPSEGIINDIEHKKAVKAFQWVNENLASSRMGDKCFLDLDPTNQTAHLQHQLKEANLLLLNIKNTIELNNIQKVFPETYPQINQFLILNK